jgi:hypothetical protein
MEPLVQQDQLVLRVLLVQQVLMEPMVLTVLLEQLDPQVLQVLLEQMPLYLVHGLHIRQPQLVVGLLVMELILLNMFRLEKQSMFVFVLL